MQTEFLKKNFPIHRTNALKRQIMNFSQKDNETFYQCWERFKNLLNACPHHGYETWRIISFFFFIIIFIYLLKFNSKDAPICRDDVQWRVFE